MSMESAPSAQNRIAVELCAGWLGSMVSAITRPCSRSPGSQAVVSQRTAVRQLRTVSPVCLGAVEVTSTRGAGRVADCNGVWGTFDWFDDERGVPAR